MIKLLGKKTQLMVAFCAWTAVFALAFLFAGKMKAQEIGAVVELSNASSTAEIIIPEDETDETETEIDLPQEAPATPEDCRIKHPKKVLKARKAPKF